MEFQLLNLEYQFVDIFFIGTDETYFLSCLHCFQPLEEIGLPGKNTFDILFSYLSLTERYSLCLQFFLKVGQKISFVALQGVVLRNLSISDLLIGGYQMLPVALGVASPHSLLRFDVLQIVSLLVEEGQVVVIPLPPLEELLKLGKALNKLSLPESIAI